MSLLSLVLVSAGTMIGVAAGGLILHGRARTFTTFVAIVMYVLTFPVVTLVVWDTAGRQFGWHPIVGFAAAVVIGIATIIGTGWPLRLLLAWRRREDDIAHAKAQIDDLHRQLATLRERLVRGNAWSQYSEPR